MISFLGLVPKWLLEEEVAYKDWLESIARDREYRLKRVNYTFCNDDEIKRLNNILLEHDYSTDIITIDHSRSRQIRADIYLGIETIESNARIYSEEYSKEAARVLAHGLLHCMGFDDHNEEDRRRMRQEEEKCLISRPK